MTRFDTLVFDLDGTLLDERVNLDGAFLAAARALYDLGEVEIDVRTTAKAAAGIAEHLWTRFAEVTTRYGLYSHDGLSEEFPGEGEDLAELRAWLPRFRAQTWASLMDTAGLPPDPEIAAAAGAEFTRARHTGRLRPLAGARRLLDRFADRRLAIMTNGPADGQRRKAEAAGLAEAVTAVVASTAAGYGKPDPGIVAAVLDAVQAPHPSTVLVVGDSPQLDGQAALNCGFPAIIVWPACRGPVKSGLHPWIHVVENLGQVAAAIAELEETQPVPAGV